MCVRHVGTIKSALISLPKFSDSSKQVEVHFIRKFDEYTQKDSLRTSPSISLPFDLLAKQWMLTTLGQLISYDDLP